MVEDEDPGWDRWEEALAPMLEDPWEEQLELAEDGPSWRDMAGWVDGDPDALGTLTTIVLVGTHVVDTVRRRVEGSGYEYAALELRALRGYRGAPATTGRSVAPPVQVPHEDAVLEWLSSVVGGEDAVDRLDDTPLPDEPFEASGLRPGLRPRVEAVSATADAVMGPLFGPEARTAARRLLAAAVQADPGLLERSERDDILAGGIAYAVAKANDLIGAAHSVTASGLQATFGLRSSPRDRAMAVARALRGPVWAMPPTPYGADLPDVLVLGSPDMLTSSFRRALIAVRDRARARRPTGP